MSTLGESRVRIAFNPSNNFGVNAIKQKAAELIDLINELDELAPQGEKLGEFRRLKALAMTDIEAGAMWAVKAATI